MARVRYIGAEPVTVPELGGRTIEPDEMAEVPDKRFGAYVCQPTVWEPIEEPRDWVWPGGEDDGADEVPPAVAPAAEPEPKPIPAKKTTAAKAATAKEGN
ncbi:hypothetical protein [Streptomyces sp. NPDC056707]|uniref:hypothetical protein n=1 Tax=Streptomyces sp. NPDC056707 TaxID=3345919 RepID=UPI0036C6751D